MKKNKTSRKFFSPKRGCIVYKCKEFDTVIMKSFITSLAVFAFAGAMASAQDTAYATSAQVEIEKLSKLEVYQLTPPSSNAFSGLGIKPTKRKYIDRWQYFAFPIKVQGKAKGGKIPAYVPELTVTLHVRFKKSTRDGSPVLLSKTIKYVDIPLNAQRDMGESKNIYIGAFISPADAFKITGGAKTGSVIGDLEGQIEAIAFEATFNGDNCVNTSSKRSFGFGGYKPEGKWWTNPRYKNNEAKLSAISETPFAMSYGTIFPPTSPLIVGGSAGSSSDSDSDSGSED